MSHGAHCTTLGFDASTWLPLLLARVVPLRRRERIAKFARSRRFGFWSSCDRRKHAARTGGAFGRNTLKDESIAHATCAHRLPTAARASRRAFDLQEQDFASMATSVTRDAHIATTRPHVRRAFIINASVHAACRDHRNRPRALTCRRTPSCR